MLMEKKNKDAKRVNLSNDDMLSLISNAIADIVVTSQNESFKNQCSQILNANGKEQIRQSAKNFFRSYVGKTANRNTNSISKSKPTSYSIAEFLAEELGETTNIVEELDGFENWEQYMTQSVENMD